MNSKNNFKIIEHEDSQAVVSFTNGTTYKISKLMMQINRFFRESVLANIQGRLKEIGLGIPPNNKYSMWNIDGVEAEILEPELGKWQKGKVRMRVILEFCPEQPEEIKNDIPQDNDNLLDDIRNQMQKENGKRIQ